jgi:hypothetical protein
VISLPTIVYRCPGPHAGPGHTWASLGVADEAAYHAALAAGWYPTLPAAVDAWRSPPAPAPTVSHVAEPVDDNAAPTRAELEQKATELGIKFDGRTGDKTLLKRIEEALSGVVEA